MRVPATRRCAALLTVVLAASGAVALSATPAAATSTDLVVSEVYGGGGNSGATFTNDFVELRNLGSAPVPVEGWSVQYASAAGTSWQVTALSGTVPAGGTLLVGEAAGAGGTTPLPTPDVTGSIALAAGAGKVALVSTAAAVSCGTSCAGAAGVRDLLGYGGAVGGEGAPAPAASTTTSVARRDGAPDTDVNAADFVAGPPTPTNAAGQGGGSGDPGVAGLRIADVQGAAHRSPYAGRRVLNVPGVVTATSARGFWMQDPAPDADPATSEGLFVFTSTRPGTVVGDAVSVSGGVSEFRAGADTGANLSTTELTGPTVTVPASGQPLPPTTVVGPGGRVPPSAVIEDDATGDVQSSGVFDPATDGVDFWESLEGMRVEIDDAQVVGPTNRFGETPVVPVGSGVRSARGGIVQRAGDPNPERVVLTGALAPVPTANVGDSYPGATVGVLDYGFGNYELLATASPTLRSGGLARETTRRPNPLQLAVATVNVQNLSPADPPAKFDRLAGYAVHNLAAPDVLALEEIQDNSGPTDDGVVVADRTLSTLVAAIRAAGGPAYGWRQIDPVNDADGGQPGGNIRVAFLFRTDRGLSFVDRAGGTPTAGTTVVPDGRGRPHLSASPGRIAPDDPAWTDSRKPLAGEFRWFGQTVFVVANHFVSKGGDDPLFGRFQPVREPSAAQRHQQATRVREFLGLILSDDARAKVVVLGDLNDYDYSATADVLVSGGSLVDLPRTLPVPERYTYDYQGNSEVLDHILISRGLAYPPIPFGTRLPLYDYDVVHVNSEFADQVSDHDPQVVRLVVLP